MLTIATMILGVAILLSLFFMIKTENTANKVIVIDILSFQALGLCMLLAFHDDSPVPLQFGLLLAMLGFLSTVVLARFIQPPKS